MSADRHHIPVTEWRTIHASKDAAYVRTEQSNVTDGAYVNVSVRTWRDDGTTNPGHAYVAYVHLTRDETVQLRDHLSAILAVET